jgi:hypothetical protein
VIQVFWWGDGFQAQIDLDRMALIGANAGRVGVEGKALLAFWATTSFNNGRVNATPC